MMGADGIETACTALRISRGGIILGELRNGRRRHAWLRGRRRPCAAPAVAVPIDPSLISSSAFSLLSPPLLLPAVLQVSVVVAAVSALPSPAVPALTPDIDSVHAHHAPCYPSAPHFNPRSLALLPAAISHQSACLSLLPKPGLLKARRRPGASESPPCPTGVPWREPHPP